MKPSLLTPLAKNHLGPVAQKAGYRYLPDKSLSAGGAIGFLNTYPLDSDLPGGQRYPAFEQLGPGAEG